jgi:hypothetical protein
MFTTLANALKRVNGAAFAEAAAYAAIMDDAITFDAVALRKRFGDACVTKKAAIAATYEAAGMASPNKSTASRLLAVGRMVNSDAHIFDGLSFIGAYELCKGVNGDVDAAREWLASHAVRTVKGIKDAFNPERCNVATSDSTATSAAAETETSAAAEGKVSDARRVLADYLYAAIDAAERANDAAALASARAALKAAVILGVPERCNVATSGKQDAVAESIERGKKDAAIGAATAAIPAAAAVAEIAATANIECVMADAVDVKKRRKSDAAKRGAETRKKAAATVATK